MQLILVINRGTRIEYYANKFSTLIPIKPLGLIVHSLCSQGVNVFAIECIFISFAAQDRIMKSDEYVKILVWPPFLVTYIPIFVYWVVMRFYRIPLDGISRWVATNVFSDIFKEKKKKTCCPREARWLLKDIDLTAAKRLLFKVLIRFFVLFYLMFGAALAIFWQLLLRDESYDCDEDDLSKDCFERKWTSEPQDPLNCSSAAVQNLIQNGTIQVICYKIVFNFGLASGVSYGSFNLSMFVIKVGASALLRIETTKMLRWAQALVGLLVLSVVTSLIVVDAVIPSAAIFFSGHPSTFIQIVTTAIISVVFLFYIPWRELIDLKTQRDNPQRSLLENCAVASV